MPFAFIAAPASVLLTELRGPSAGLLAELRVRSALVAIGVFTAFATDLVRCFGVGAGAKNGFGVSCCAAPPRDE